MKQAQSMQAITLSAYDLKTVHPVREAHESICSLAYISCLQDLYCHNQDWAA